MTRGIFKKGVKFLINIQREKMKYWRESQAELTMDKTVNCESRSCMVIDRTHYMFHIAFLKIS